MIKLIISLIVVCTTLSFSAENINRSVAIDKSFKYHNGFDNAKLKYVHLVPNYKKEIEVIKKKVNPAIAVELFSSIPKSKIKGTDKLTTVYNTLRDYNSMQGINYYSVSKNKMKTLFKNSYPTDKNWKKIETKKVSAIPKTEEVNFYQKDLTLGANKNFGTFKSDKNSLISHFYNTNDLNYMFLTVVDQENLHSFFVVQEKAETIELYALSFVKPAALPLIKERISKSFGNRLVAMYNWFYSNITK